MSSATAYPTVPGYTRAGTRDYHVMGGVLRSELEFPDLPASRQANVDWRLRISHSPPPPTETKLLGMRQIGVEHYRLSRITGGFRLAYSHAGTFDLHGGSRVTWYRDRLGAEELARSIVLGPVMALILESQRFLCLHGSAVTIGEHAIGFVGGKHMGKSTTALALVAAGAKLISDDLIAIRAERDAWVRPGISSARLWEDTARELRIDQLCSRVAPGIKQTVSGFPESAVHSSTARLGALYVLEPVHSLAGGLMCEREQLGGGAATVAISMQRKLPDNLVGGEAAGEQLRLAAGVARVVPVYTLRVVRAFARLPEVAAQLVEWHASQCHEADAGR